MELFGKMVSQTSSMEYTSQPSLRPPNDNLYIKSDIGGSLNVLAPYDNVTKGKTYRDLSENVTFIFYVVNYGVIGPCVCVLGIIGNTFNIIVFAKQGFQETVNVTLFAMAISDLVSLITFLYMAISFNPLFTQADLSFYPIEVQVLFGGWPHVMFLRITAWLTAFISIERCFCVIFPLKVKTIFTLRRVKGGVIAIYIMVTASMAPTYYYTRLGWRFVPERNRSMLGLTYTHDSYQIKHISYLINSLISSFSYFAIILVSTSVLVVSLSRKTKWRLKVSVTGNDRGPPTSNKDQKVIKLVVTIAIIFIVFLLPSFLVFLGEMIEPELYIAGKYQNMFKAFASLTMTLETVNSSVNTLVYYKMSSNYRNVFRTVICREKAET